MIDLHICNRKQLHIAAAILIALAFAFALWGPGSAYAASSDVKYNGRVIAHVNGSGQKVLVPSSNANDNYKNITYLIKGNKNKTIVFPKGSKIKLNGVLRPGSNTTIIATGCKIYGKPKSNAVFCAPNKKLKNIHITGGTWRSPDKGGRTGSLLAFAFVDGLVLDGIDCNANYKGHAIEVIACKNVTIKNSKVAAIGKNPANCLEEQIQIDIATKKTAPKIAEYGSKYVKGQTCSNVYLLNNRVSGARAIGINWTNSESRKWVNKFHRNIVIKDNHLTGTTSEALAVFNTMGATVNGNTIITKAKRTTNNSSYTIGLHIAMMGTAPAKMATSVFTIENNTIYGSRNGIHVKGYFPDESKPAKSKFGTVVVRDNQVFCRKGKDKAIAQVRDSCKEFIVEGNTVSKWS